MRCEECMYYNDQDRCPPECDPELLTNPEDMMINAKGRFFGACNRRDCLSIKDVVWFNHSTRAFYCPTCAEMLNDVNRKDAHELFGHDLCEKVSICRTCKGTGESPHGGPCCMCDGRGYFLEGTKG